MSESRIGIIFIDPYILRRKKAKANYSKVNTHMAISTKVLLLLVSIIKHYLYVKPCRKTKLSEER